MGSFLDWVRGLAAPARQMSTEYARTSLNKDEVVLLGKAGVQYARETKVPEIIRGLKTLFKEPPSNIHAMRDQLDVLVAGHKEASTKERQLLLGAEMLRTPQLAPAQSSATELRVAQRLIEVAKSPTGEDKLKIIGQMPDEHARKKLSNDEKNMLELGYRVLHDLEDTKGLRLKTGAGGGDDLRATFAAAKEQGRVAARTERARARQKNFEASPADRSASWAEKVSTRDDVRER